MHLVRASVSYVRYALAVTKNETSRLSFVMLPDHNRIVTTVPPTLTYACRS